jgi:hypothetical protein
VSNHLPRLKEVEDAANKHCRFGVPHRERTRPMNKTPLLLVSFCGLTALTVSPVLGDVPAPPVNQNIGLPDTVAGELQEADCRVCHSSGVPDRHHMLYGQLIPGGSLVPYPDSDGDTVADLNYACLSCHDQNFNVVRDCVTCHNQGSPHHTTPAAVALNCSACHGDLVDDPYDGHYVPTYSPSLVTPYRGLNGDGYENAPFPTPDLASDGSGTLVPADVTATTAGPPFFTVTNIGPLGTVHFRKEPAALKFKPAGNNNDFFIGSTHHSGEEFNVVFNAGSPLAASWDTATQTLTVTLDATQTTLEVVNVINAATAGVDVRASLGYDGEDPVLDLLAPEHYEPLGGNPPNSRGFGAGSCSYCHDTDGILDANGDPAGVIWDNHTNHHEIGLSSQVSDGAGGTKSKCNVCHERATAGQQSGPNFDFAIRHCESCHGPDSLHNIQADSPNPANIGTLVIGGEDAGYGHVGRDAGPGNSDCWGCHGFAAATAPRSGPIVPTLYNSGLSILNSGTDTSLVLSGAGFTNQAGDLLFESDVLVTADDGSTVTLNPDALSQDLLTVTIQGTMAPGNYSLQAVKGDSNSNPVVISIVPEVVIVDAAADGKTVTINGRGFSGYAAGSITSVTATDSGVKGAIVSWSDTTIVAEFQSRPTEVTVTSVFGTATSEVRGGTELWLFVRGDCNDDGEVDISDAVFTLSSLFLGEGKPSCDDACDSNDDGAVDLSDAVNTLGALFLGNAEPPLPGMRDCGVDPTDDNVGCEESRRCP